MSSAPKKRKTFLLAIGSLGLLIACAAVGFYFYTIWAADKELREAIAEADRLDPGWRLEELEAKREVIPDAENGALRVLAAKQLIPGNWPNEAKPAPNESREELDSDKESPVTLEERISELSPEVLLSRELTNELRNQLESVAPALAEARPLVNLSKGRFPISWPLDFISTPSFCQDTRAVTKLFWLQGVLLAQENDADGALAAGGGTLNAARAIGDEPMLISQLVRWAGQRLAAQSMERTLAQGQPSERALVAAQKLMEDEAAQATFLTGIRGERAGYHRMMQAISNGELKASQIGGLTKARWQALIENVSLKRSVRQSHGSYLRLLTEAVEIAKLAPEEQASRFKQLDARQNEYTPLMALLLPMFNRVAGGVQRTQAYLRCSYVALAVERYRLAHGRWPDSLAVLIPEFLDKVPTDPYDGKPLRYRRLDDGVVIYSIGRDGKDDGGKLDRNDQLRSGIDFGFQLWDVNRRRQPWRPAKAGKDDER